MQLFGSEDNFADISMMISDVIRSFLLLKIKVVRCDDIIATSFHREPQYLLGGRQEQIMAKGDFSITYKTVNDIDQMTELLDRNSLPQGTDWGRRRFQSTLTYIYILLYIKKIGRGNFRKACTFGEIFHCIRRCK